MPIEVLSDERVVNNPIAFSDYMGNEKLFTLESQNLSTDLFNLNDQLNLLDHRMKALLRKVD